jgi:Cupredoxin-like domain
MHRSRRTALALVAFALATAVAGCSAGSGTSAPEVVLKDGATLRVKLTEYKVDPQRVDIKAGKDGVAELTLVAENDGRIPHDLAIGRGGYIIGRTTTIKPGQTAVAKGFRLPIGTYRIFCTVSNHDTLGQYGFLVVR